MDCDSQDNNDLLDIDSAAEALGLSREEAYFLTKNGTMQSVTGSDDIDACRYSRSDINAIRFGFGCQVFFDYSSDKYMRIPHRKFVVYLVSFFGDKHADVDKYLRYMGLSVSQPIVSAIYNKLVDLAPTKQFAADYMAGRHRGSKQFNSWVERVGVSSIYSQRVSMPVLLAKNRNVRLMVETAGSAGVSADKITRMVKKTFNVEISENEVTLWNEYMYNVGDMDTPELIEALGNYYMDEPKGYHALRMSTMRPSPVAISKLQSYYVINYDHAWQELWSIIAGMTIEQVFSAIQSGEATQAKLWADVIEQALEYGKKGEANTIETPIAAALDHEELDITLDDIA